MPSEPVYTIVGYRDEVRSGVAEYAGQPHAFALEQEATATSPAVYVLVPLGPEFEFPTPPDADLWEPSAEIRQLVASLGKESHSKQFRRRGSFHPVSGGHAPDSFAVFWQPESDKSRRWRNSD